MNACHHAWRLTQQSVRQQWLQLGLEQGAPLRATQVLQDNCSHHYLLLNQQSGPNLSTLEKPSLGIFHHRHWCVKITS